MELYERLTELRKENGLSQEKLAELLNISRQAVSKWETGASNPDINNIIQLGKLYGVSTDYIL
ncbi:MAG: helix-turn-helix domain-containing protein [Lachnospiraceae bacterium]|nr:helix-turn-helix domain-containing protein [Lachnospiraceae bacterium]